ncbi:MAG: extracellular solute-binding protein [Anaerolineae bacterium]|nr:extracellular solute-binding protein [Anaerolineae bacterium]
MLRKLLIVGLLVSLLVAALPLQAQEDITLRYFTFSAAPDYLEELDEIVAAFEAENPGITVEVSTAPFSDYFTLLQADFVGNNPPDAFELNYENFVTYAANDVLLDLSPYLSAEAPYYPPRAGSLPVRRRATGPARELLRPCCCSTTQTSSTRPGWATPPLIGPGKMRWKRAAPSGHWAMMSGASIPQPSSGSSTRRLARTTASSSTKT